MQILMTPEVLLTAYAQGLFPMAQSAQSDTVNWYCPEMRGQLSIAHMHIPRRLRKNVRQMKIQASPYEVRIDYDFRSVMHACAECSKGRDETWINQKIIDSFCELHACGHAHSVEIWQNNNLVGGLYGVSMGAAFFGESMFSRSRDASKVALVHLVARLYAQGYQILDTQFTNDHLKQFGVFEVSYDDFMGEMKRAMQKKCIFNPVQQDEKNLIAQYLEMQMLPWK